MALDFTWGRTLLDTYEAVTLTRPASYSGGAAASVMVSPVQAQAATADQIDTPMDGALYATTRTFRLWLVDCQGLPPAEGYQITTADGTVWVVKRLDVLCHGQQFRCHCVARLAGAA